MNNPLITVVIPIYKVERYLSKCVDSVLGQTYENMEIILVDDGSPDRCGQICDEYALKDNRIIVIHQENQGLSGARNSAISISKGEFITFVDSDDYIDRNMIKTMYKQMVEDNADMVVTALESFFEDGTRISNAHGGRIFKLSKEQALDCFLFNDYLTPCACGKLYKSTLWNDIRFPQGKLFEDQFTIYKVIDLCKKVVYMSTPMYHYRKRDGSIGHSNFSERTYDLYSAINEEYKFIYNKYYRLCPNVNVEKITWELVFINMMINGKYYDGDIVKKSQKFARDNILKVVTCRYINVVRKIQIVLFCIDFNLYKAAYLKYKEQHPLA